MELALCTGTAASMVMHGPDGQSHTFFPQNAYLSTTNSSNTINGVSNSRVAHAGQGSTTASAVPTYSNKDYELYKTYELRAKLFIHKRFELNGIAAINDNSALTNGVRERISGISDITTYVGYHAMQHVDFTNLQQRLIIGAGIKLPTANYYAANKDGTRYPLIIQPGTGSTDYFGMINYILGYKRFGASVNSMYKINGQNYYKEKIANSATNNLSIFFKIPVKQVILMPSVQAYYEYTKGLYVNNVLTNGTEMNVLLLGPGLDIHYKNFGVNAAIQFRGWEHTKATNLSSTGRMVLGLSYFFNQRGYLFKSKQT